MEDGAATGEEWVYGSISSDGCDACDALRGIFHKTPYARDYKKSIGKKGFNASPCVTTQGEPGATKQE